MHKVIVILGILAAFTLGSAREAIAITLFPEDAGVVNVRDFGAKGDGVADDTAAINAALTKSGGDTGPTFWQDRIVYFPDGTYLVSNRIIKRYENGKFGSGSILVGQSRENTIIKLEDNAPGYTDPEHPKAIIFTTAKLLDGNETSGGKDYTNKGEGNDAYMNYVENMTIDAGHGNTGAIGIDYLASNMGAIRNVTVSAPEGSGATGIALTRKWPGPALIENVDVEGFKTGIDAGNTEYGMTLERITLRKQHVALRNNHNMLTVHELNVDGAFAPIVNQSHDGLLVISGGRIKQGGLSGEAIYNYGFLNTTGLNISGYKTILGTPNTSRLNGVYEGNKFIAPVPNWSLPVESPPPAFEEPLIKWVSIAEYTKPDSGTDATDGIRKAFATGASTIYFPHGVYLVHDNITVPPSVQRIVGMTSTIRPKDRLPQFSRDSGIFIATNNRKPLVIEKLAFDNSYMGDQTAVEARGMMPLFLQDVIGAGVKTLLRPEKGGKVYMENTCCGTVSVAGKQGVWARQLNSEGPGVRVDNHGAPLWILGVKTEGDCTVLDNNDGAHTQVLGGLVYITGNRANPVIPAFRNTDSQLLLSYVEEAFDPAGTYKIHLADSKNGKVKNTMADMLPKRNVGRMAAQITSQ